MPPTCLRYCGGDFVDVGAAPEGLGSLVIRLRLFMARSF